MEENNFNQDVRKNYFDDGKKGKLSFKEQMKEPSTWILIALVIVILVILGFIIAGFLRDKKTNDEALDAINRFDEVVDSNPLRPDQIDPSKPKDFQVPNTDATKKDGSRVKMGEYDVVGTLRIPKTKVNYPILTPVDARSLEKGLAMLESTNGVNKPGNTVILGHNYRNNMFFSKNHTLKNGDKIYVKDLYGKEVEYTIYKGEYVTPSYSDYIRRDTQGRTELSLSTCSDTSEQRYLIFAKRTNEPSPEEARNQNQRVNNTNNVNVRNTNVQNNVNNVNVQNTNAQNNVSNINSGLSNTQAVNSNTVRNTNVNTNVNSNTNSNTNANTNTNTNIGRSSVN